MAPSAFRNGTANRGSSPEGAGTLGQRFMQIYRPRSTGKTATPAATAAAAADTKQVSTGPVP